MSRIMSTACGGFVYLFRAPERQGKQLMQQEASQVPLCRQIAYGMRALTSHIASVVCWPGGCHEDIDC